MDTIIQFHHSRDGLTNSIPYDRIHDLTEKTLGELKISMDDVRSELQKFLIKHMITTSNPEALVELLITPWVRGKQVLHIVSTPVMSTSVLGSLVVGKPDFSGDRDKIKKAKTASQTLIEQLNELNKHGTMPCIFNLDVNVEIDFDALIKINKEFINYAEALENQCFVRGRNPLSSDKIKELMIFTLFYIGQELLGLGCSEKPYSLFTFAKIVTSITFKDSILDDSNIAAYYKRYCKKISEYQANAVLDGERHGVKYSITPYQDGYKLDTHSNAETTLNRFLKDQTNEKEVKLLKFIYGMRIPDHVLTMFIFDTSVLEKIINLTH